MKGDDMTLSDHCCEMKMVVDEQKIEIGRLRATLADSEARLIELYMLSVVAKKAARLLSPPYHRSSLVVGDDEMRHWKELRQALYAAGVGFEEYT